MKDDENDLTPTSVRQQTILAHDGESERGMETSVEYSASWEDEDDGGEHNREARLQNSGAKSELDAGMGLDSQNSANVGSRTDFLYGKELAEWLDEFTKDILQRVLANLESSGMLTDVSDHGISDEESKLDEQTPPSALETTREEAELRSAQSNSQTANAHASSRGRAGMANEVGFRTRPFSSLPSVVTWALHPAQRISPKARFSTLPSVVSWLPVGRSGAFCCLPSVVTWIRMHNPRPLTARSLSRASKWIDAFDGVEEEAGTPVDGKEEDIEVEAPFEDEERDPSQELVEATFEELMEEPDPDWINVMLDEKEEILLGTERTHLGLELSAEDAALRLQRTCRGMLDRKFFRKYRAKVARQSQPANMRRKQQEVLIKSVSVKMPMIEADGYLSKTTLKKLQSRGEPLEFTKVEEKYNQIRTKPFVSFDIHIPSQDIINWHVGESKSIKWKTTGNIEISKVGLYLYRDGEPIHTIVKAVPNGGKYIFSLPDTISAGEDSFQVLIIAEHPKMPHVHAFTQPFSVRERKPGMLVRVPTAIPKLISTFPTRPGWSWIAGDTNMISWTSEGVVQNVGVDILRQGKLAMRLSGSCLNVGAFQFPMPLDAPFGEGFQIRVRCTTNKAAFCLSYPFSIIDRQVALAVPRRAPKASRKKSLGTASSLPDLSQSRLLKPLAPPSLSGSVELTPAGSAAWALHAVPNGRLGAPSLNTTASSGFSLSRSLPNAHGLSAISFESSAPSVPEHPDAEARTDAEETAARRRRKTASSRSSIRSPYLAARAGSGGGGMAEMDRVGERAGAASVDTSVDRWMGSDMQRFTERGERALSERVSTGRLMASALSEIEMGGQGRRRAKSQAGGRGRGGEEGSLGAVIGGRRGVGRTRIISGAEEFLELRDRMLEEQMARLRDSFAGPASAWDRGAAGGGGGKYVPALLPELLERDARRQPPAAGEALGPGGAQWKQYERARIRGGTPSTAISEYVDQVQERIFSIQADRAR